MGEHVVHHILGDVVSVEAWKQPEQLVRVRMSYEEYEALPADIHAEWAAGVVVMAPSGLWDHNDIARNVADAVRDALPTTRQALDTTIYLPGDRERRPDVVVMAERPRGSYPVVADDGPPLIVVEVISPSTRSEDWIRKSNDYAAAGIGQYWLVDQDARQLWVHELVDGEWQELLRLGGDTDSRGDVRVGDLGTVSLDLDALLDV